MYIEPIEYLYLHIIEKIMIMKRVNIKTSLFLIVSFIISLSIKAQQFEPNTEVGPFLGASYYLGDLNTTHFYQPLAATGMIVRQNIDKRFVYKAEILYTSLRKQYCIFCLQSAPIITFVLYVFQGLQPNICKIVSFYSPIL